MGDEMIQLTINRSYLAAVLHVAAKADIRYYLNGVYVEALPTETRLVATNGSALACARVASENTTPLDFIIPRDVVENAVKIKADVLTLTIDSAGFSIGARGVVFSFVPVDAKFPQYRRVISSTPDLTAGYFDIEHLQQFAKAQKSLGIKSPPIIRQNGTNSALVHFYGFDDFVGVVMPFNHFTAKSPDMGWPTWGSM